MPLIGNREYTVHVVGESFYEENLSFLCGPATDHMRQFARIASLTLEGNNPYDRNAIRVDIDGLTVGHLSRFDAARFRARRGDVDGSCYTCDAVMISLRGNAAADYGVRLDFGELTQVR
jgi:hypothetical protein